MQKIISICNNCAKKEQLDFFLLSVESSNLKNNIKCKRCGAKYGLVDYNVLKDLNDFSDKRNKD